MTLELAGGQDNSRIVVAGNISASNDPAQLQHDLNEQMIKGAEVLAAGETLGLSRDEAIAIRRTKQREAYMRRKLQQENAEYAQDEQIKQTAEYERTFQKDKPQSDADVLGIAEFGSNEADLQQVSSGRIGSVQAQDQSGLGRTDRSDRAFRGARRDQLPYRVGTVVEDEGGVGRFVSGSVPVGQPVPRDLREAAIIQDAELDIERSKPPAYKYNASGTGRRNFGTVLKDGDDKIIQERLSRVKRPRPSGQTLNPDDVISTDKYLTARRGRERGIGNDGPQEPRRVRNTPGRAQLSQNSAYQALVAKLETGEIDINTRVSDPSRAGGETKTVGELMDRMLESADPQTAVRNARYEGRQAVRENYPVTTESTKRRARSRATAEEDIIKLIATGGSTEEVIGETVMSDEAWKAKSQKVIPNLPIQDKADVISNQQVFQMTNADGQVVGHSNGARFVGDTNDPRGGAMLNAPTNADESLIKFISENLSEPSGGGDFDVQIGQATTSFTDQVAAQKGKRFGTGLDQVPPGLRSFDNASAVMARLIERGEQAGTPFSRYNPENPSKPSKVPPGQKPTVDDLMSTLNIDPKSKTQLADALYQMSLAEGQGVNQAGKEQFQQRQGSYANPEQGIMFDSPAGRFYDGAEVEYVSNSQRARVDGKNTNLQPALRNIQNPDGSPVDPESRAPFIGATAEDGPRPMRYRKGFAPGVSIEQGYADLERGMVKGNRGYSQKRVDSNVALGRELERRQARTEENKSVDRVMRQAESASFEERMVAQDGMDFQRELKNQRLLREGLAGGNALNSTQPIAPARVAPSIAPDPWSMSASPETATGSGGGGAQPPRRPPALPYGFSEGPSQGPSKRSDFARTGDYKTPAGPGNAQGRVNRRLSQMENIRTNPKYQRGRRIGYGIGGTAALFGALGIANNDDEREEQNR